MKRKILAFLTAAILSFGTVLIPDITNSLSLTAIAQITVAAPAADQEAGLHNIETDSLAVHLTTDTPNADIYYKIDDGSYTKYNGAVNITKNCKLYTYAELNGTQSPVAEYEYSLGAKYNWSIRPGSYTENQVVKVTTNVPGVKLYYSVDGKQATKSSKEMPANGVLIENTTSFSVLSAKEGWSSVGNVYTFNINKLNNDRINHFYYDQLSDKGKELYYIVYSAMQSGSTDSISIGYLELDRDIAANVMEALNKERCTLVGPDYAGHWYTSYYYTTSQIASHVKLNYSINDAYIISAQKKFDEAAAKIIEEAKKQPTSYEKLKYIHDWLVDNVTYLSSSDSDWVNYADAPIVKGFGNCNGYARAFSYLAQALGFDCITLGGSVGEGALHAWNKVKLDGEWYNVDVTWDDRGSKIYYDYFLVCDEQFHKNHTPGTKCTYPVSAARNYDPDAEHELSVKTVRGDANNDGKVDLSDVIAVMRAIVNGTESTLSPGAELTGDGKITLADLTALLKIIVGTN